MRRFLFKAQDSLRQNDSLIYRCDYIDCTGISWWNEKIHCWYLDERYKSDYEKVAPLIRDELKQSCRETTPRIATACYMLGTSKEEAHPTIVFACAKRAYAEEAQKIVKKSPILFGYPQFRTKAMPSLPTGKIIPVAKETNKAVISPMETFSDQHNFIISDTVSNLKVYFDRSKGIETTGMGIFVQHIDGSIRQATANAISTGDDVYYLSAGHAFRERVRDTEDFSDWGDDYKLTMDNEADEEFDSQNNLLHVDDPSSASGIRSSTRQGRSASSSISNSSDRYWTEITSNSSTKSQNLQQPLSDTAPHVPPTRAVPSMDNLTLLGESSESYMEGDWALIRITNLNVTDYLQGTRDRTQLLQNWMWSLEPPCHVIIHTSHGPIPGRLLPTPVSLHIPTSSCYDEVYQIAYYGKLEEGDCGSFVFSEGGKDLVGHVIADSKDGFVCFATTGKTVKTAVMRLLQQEDVMWFTPEERTMSLQSGASGFEMVFSAPSENLHGSKETLGPGPRFPSLPPNSDPSRHTPTVIVDSMQQADKNAMQLLQRESERQLWFQNEANHQLQVPNGYLKVAVLIIRWDEKIDESLGHTEEIARLRAIFENRFSFVCEVVELENVRDPQVDLNWHILGHIRKYDGPNNLLMVYYTGHGSKVMTENGERLELTAARTWTPTRDTRTPMALWHEAESPLLERAEGDVLSILDCCFAGSAGNKSRNQEMRNYQLLAASASGRPTKGPGDNSLTKALCDSLDELLDASGENGSFTVIELWEKINTKRKTQAALVWDPLKRYNRSIRLAPLRAPTTDWKHSFQVRDPEKASLELRISLKEKDLSRAQIETLAHELVHGCKEANVPIRKLEWIKMDVIPENQSISKQEIMSAKRVMSEYKRRRSRSSGESLGRRKRTTVSTVDHNKPATLPSPDHTT